MNEEKNKIDDNEKKNKKHFKLPNVLEAGFIAPDGGWGWMIVIASGFSNFCTLSVMLSFGLIFRDRFQQLGISVAQATTITNINNAVTACTALTNGPLYRRYSCRQVACFGGLLSALSICTLSFMSTFRGILTFYSIFYAIGNSLCMTSCSLSLNTYFKKKRRTAVCLSWTCTGLAPIVIPQIVTLLVPLYDVSGTVLLFGGMMFNAVACALLLQPVGRHAKKESDCEGLEARAKIDSIKESDEMCRTLLTESIKALPVEKAWHRGKLLDVAENRSSRRFGSQYLYYDDEEQGATGLDVIDSTTPMMSRANDGWFAKLNSSNMSLTSKNTINKDTSQPTNLRRTSIACGNWEGGNTHHTNDAPQTVEVNKSCENTDNNQKQTIDDLTILSNGDKMAMQQSLLGLSPSMRHIRNDKEDTSQTRYKRVLHAVGVFFDLDLLQDPVYVNIMMGITLVNFADVNAFVLMPFILSDNLARKIDVANIMSVLAIVDVITRLAIPFIATAIGWENRSYYIVAMIMLAASRMLLAYVKTYDLLMATAIIGGAGKAFRQVFVALVIPTHVPLERLPAATGLQLTAGGITYLTFGPIVGWIRDICGGYTVSMHFLNCFTYLVMICWITELCYTSMKKKRLDKNTGNSTLTNLNTCQLKCSK